MVNVWICIKSFQVRFGFSREDTRERFFRSGLVASTIIPPLREGRSASCCSMMARGSKRYVLRQQASNLD